MLETLTKSCFIPNKEKSTKATLTRLGIDTVLVSGILKITRLCVDIILNTISSNLQEIFISARTLAKLVEKLISTK